MVLQLDLKQDRPVAVSAISLPVAAKPGRIATPTTTATDSGSLPHAAHFLRSSPMFAKHRLAMAIALLAGLASASPGLPGADQAVRQVELKKGDRILFLGDSLTYLAGKEEPKKSVTKGYVRMVQETLDKTHKELGIQVELSVATGGAHRFLTSSSVSTRMSFPSIRRSSSSRSAATTLAESPRRRSSRAWRN